MIESNRGPLAFIAPRGGYTDAVLTFPLLDGKSFNTDWPVHISFPLFLFNACRCWATRGKPAARAAPARPARRAPRRRSERPHRGHRSRRPSDTIDAHASGHVRLQPGRPRGLYHAHWGNDGALPFAVNLFDSRESDLAPRGLVPEGTPPDQQDPYKIKIGYTPVAGTRKSAPAERSWWPYFAGLMLAVVLFEWYVYNRRVYI